jgi:hypothetical protein
MYQSNFRQFTAQLLMAVLLFGTVANIANAQRLDGDTGMTTEDVENTTTPNPTCTEGAFKTTGNSSVDGPNGNTRTYNFGSVSVHITAFARKVSTGQWENAYLGAYASGLGVTDSSESGANDTHKVDNSGTYKNYVLYEFNQPVVIDRVGLDAISSDSDMSAWIGTAADPYNNHLTLSDAMLAGFGRENNGGSASSPSRWADINAANEPGNVLVVAANPDSSNDWFKIDALDFKCPPPPCPTTTITTTGGDTSSDGPDGNIRNFSSGSVSVHASAFSRTNVSGTWETGFLGAYGPGVGVTDRGEGTGSNDRHKVDNIGDRKNFVLFEFNQDVVVDELYLDAIGDAAGNDSDITVWIGSGTDPYMNHMTLNDAVLSSFGAPESNDTTSTTSRWANINAAGKVGNVIVVAASVSDTSPEDAFKIRHIKLQCPGAHRGKVTIIKEVFTANGTSSSQLFNFTANNLGNFNFNLKDENVMGPDRFINANITAFGPTNPITVTESLTNGWTLSDILCSETGGTSNTTVNFDARTANIIVEPGESVTCIFRNTQATPSAAHASVSGRAVLADGTGVSGATLSLTDISSGEVRTVITNGFGYYSFENLQVNTFYTLTIEHKRYFFEQNTRSFTLMDDLTSLDFVQTF